MNNRFRFDRLEFAGSLGDLGTLLPLAIGMIMINNLSPVGLFCSIGLYYILAGIYFKLTVPIQPMKVIGAYAIATGMAAPQILAAGFLMGVLLLVIGATGLITLIGKYTPKSVVRGVQLSTGILLMASGVKFMIGTSSFQIMHKAVEPYLLFQSVGMVPIGIVIGIIGGILTLFLLDNKKFPAGMVVVGCGMLVGLLLGTHKDFGSLTVGLNLPELMPSGWPSVNEFTLAFLILVLPQVPMTMGNAVIAYADLSKEYFGEDSNKITYRSTCISMALANFISFFMGGMPLCHGAGGLAAHYRFGARSAGSNIMIGLIFVLLSVLLGNHSLAIIYLIPMSILGVLLLFAGGQLALTVMDMNVKKDLFVALMITGITLASNLAVGFVAGIVLAYLLKWDKLSV